MKTQKIVEEEEVVRKGYDDIAREYQAKRQTFDNVEVLTEFFHYLPKCARILDAGCGAGVPCADLAMQAGFEVVGVDFSSSMLKMARKNVPEADLIKEDMTKLGFPDNSFDGLIALYSIIHVPREMHASLYQQFHEILKPEGMMLMCIGSDEWEGTDAYFGTQMFWSEPSLENTLKMVKNAGFQILSGKHLVIGGERAYWITARNQ
ncbi:MAG: class I SAM-dependent methyltransferase [Candidatus Bathyarchaeota archaeon]|nr:MAG: class I SAM-dependent methyltransferase [Candidatus Bathyarchaeota archaeon]